MENDKRQKVPSSTYASTARTRLVSACLTALNIRTASLCAHLPSGVDKEPSPLAAVCNAFKASARWAQRNKQRALKKEAGVVAGKEDKEELTSRRAAASRLPCNRADTMVKRRRISSTPPSSGVKENMLAKDDWKGTVGKKKEEKKEKHKNNKEQQEQQEQKQAIQSPRKGSS